MVVNRKSIHNFALDLSYQVETELNDQTVFVRHPQGMYCLWFHTVGEATSFEDALQDVTDALLEEHKASASATLMNDPAIASASYEQKHTAHKPPELHHHTHAHIHHEWSNQVPASVPVPELSNQEIQALQQQTSPMLAPSTSADLTRDAHLNNLLRKAGVKNLGANHESSTLSAAAATAATAADVTDGKKQHGRGSIMSNASTTSTGSLLFLRSTSTTSVQSDTSTSNGPITTSGSTPRPKLMTPAFLTSSRVSTSSTAHRLDKDSLIALFQSKLTDTKFTDRLHQAYTSGLLDSLGLDAMK
jgi:Dcp1-like decapping family